MAKYDEREGNSCHIHLSLRGRTAEPVFADDTREGGHSDVFDHFLAGVLATMREFSYFYAPNINSYKRFQPGLRADRDRLGPGQPDLRPARRRSRRRPAGENRVPGGDVNPYLAVAAMLAGGLHGIERD
jgi:glutamine synthetase